jgi:inorganic triphosphatase YgiF
MSDRKDASSSWISGREAERRVGSTAKGDAERGFNVVAELLDAAQSAAESLLGEQKRRAAEQVSGIAGALRSAAHSLGRSENRAAARYAHQAADQVENFLHAVRDRDWREIVADIENFARREPTWFVLGAVVTGFLVGRFLWASTDDQRSGGAATRASRRSETIGAVTAAVSSGSGAGTDGRAGYGAGTSGAMEVG